MLKNLYILNEGNKNRTNKMPLFRKNVVQFGFFTKEIECERGKHDFSNKSDRS